MLANDLGVNGIELASNAVEQLGPLSFELTIHQALSLGQVGDPGETVVLLQVIETSGLRLSRQPFPSVESDLNGERKPSLDAGIQKAEDRMDLVVGRGTGIIASRFELRYDSKTCDATYPIHARARAREAHFAGTNTTGDWRDENSQWRRAADVPH